MNKFGNHLRVLREHRQISVREFAKQIGKSPGYISRIEARDEIPNASFVCDIAAFYGVPAAELLELAKKSQLEKTAHDIDKKHAGALTLFRKDNRKPRNRNK